MPKFVIERDFQKLAVFRRSNYRRYRKSRVEFYEGWALRFSGFRATSRTTKSTAYLWPPMKMPYVSMPCRAVFRPTESRAFGRWSIRQPLSRRKSCADTNLTDHLRLLGGDRHAPFSVPKVGKLEMGCRGCIR